MYYFKWPTNHSKHLKYFIRKLLWPWDFLHEFKVKKRTEISNSLVIPLQIISKFFLPYFFCGQLHCGKYQCWIIFKNNIMIIDWCCARVVDNLLSTCDSIVQWLQMYGPLCLCCLRYLGWCPSLCLICWSVCKENFTAIEFGKFGSIPPLSFLDF